MSRIRRFRSQVLATSSVLLALHAWLGPELAHAAGAGNAATTSEVDDALVRYKRALELFNDGSYDAASLEFRRAYELAPNYRVLYNIALVSVQLNDYAAALNAFEKYLADGGTEVPTARLTEVKREVARLSPRVATLSVTTDVPGAEVSVDDLAIGRTPFAEPVRINAGRRRVSVAAAGSVPQTRVVEAAGGDALVLTFEMSAPHVKTEATPRSEPLTSPREESHRVPWLGWTLSGVLAASTAATGVLALKAHSDQDALKHRSDLSPSELDSAQKKVQHLALATDVLLGATAIASGISLYLTLSTSRAEPTTNARARLLIRPGGVSAELTF